MNKKILIADDDKMLRNMYVKKLQIAGFKVETAGDGEEAIAKAGTLQPNLILMDVMMPRLDGFGALTKFKSDPKTQNIPVILLTNLGINEEDKKRGLELGAKEYLIKNQLSPNQIVEIVKKYL